MYGVISYGMKIGSSRWPSRPQPWVAQLTALDDHYGFVRVFVKGVYDYIHATKGTGKGTRLYFALAPGLYEANHWRSWKHEQRDYFHVDEQGNINDMTKEAVIECLKNAISE